jgi:hypothetical protein
MKLPLAAAAVAAAVVISYSPDVALLQLMTL